MTNDAGAAAVLIEEEVEVLKAIYGEDNVVHNKFTITENTTTKRCCATPTTTNQHTAAVQKVEDSSSSNSGCRASVKVIHSSSRTTSNKGTTTTPRTLHEVCVGNLEANSENDSGGPHGGSAVAWRFDLIFRLTDGYPHSTDTCEVNAGWIDITEAKNLSELALQSLSPPTPSIWAAVEVVREAIRKPPPSLMDATTLVSGEGALDLCDDLCDDVCDEEKSDVHLPAIDDLHMITDYCSTAAIHIQIYHGEPIVDRKSIFQAHVATVHDLKEVRAVRDALLSDSKIARAAHNILAYRIRQAPRPNRKTQQMNGSSSPSSTGHNTDRNCNSSSSIATNNDEHKDHNSSFAKKYHKHRNAAAAVASPDACDGTRLLQDHDSDGENHAGGRLQHLLDILNVENVLVVVTRWYGGILLGPDRFRHINNAARLALMDRGDLMDRGAGIRQQVVGNKTSNRKHR
eukprot:Lankesteria_metandrocarpae@DN2654_c0_g1_i1.p1